MSCCIELVAVTTTAPVVQSPGPAPVIQLRAMTAVLAGQARAAAIVPDVRIAVIGGAQATSTGGGGGDLVNPMTTAGDLILGGSAGAPGRLGAGSDGSILRVDPTSHLPAWGTNAPAWGNLTGIPSTFSPSAHASSHATGGSD